jgi:hypothetical protein
MPEAAGTHNSVARMGPGNSPDPLCDTLEPQAIVDH